MGDANDPLTRTSDRLVEATDEIRSKERQKRKTPIGTRQFNRLAREVVAWADEAADLAHDELALGEEAGGADMTDTINGRAARHHAGPESRA